ncbi:helix-turn-helix domain-containing protein [Stutzerimonas nitrititolerans]|nr:helix-turn-helix domain-containing protein [Stutzerimonas nitrititolerans]
MNPPLYTQVAFAALAGVSVDTVARWIRTGAVESVKLGNTRLVRFPGVNQ